MLTALILICSLSVTPNLRDCTRDNARVAMQVPSLFSSPMHCVLHGQTYVAETALGAGLGPEDRIKIVCARTALADEEQDR